MEGFFGKEGHLSKTITSFEFRKEQNEMADFILERLYESENGIIEAGTGTGKTLAYLVPAVQFALENDKRLVISTETKALQKQLVDKDLPIVNRVFSKHLGIDFTYSLCLGSSNYPCRRRFESALKSGRFTPGEMKKLGKVGQLFNEKKVFTRFDCTLSFHLWSSIQREGDACNSYRCSFSSICPYQIARKEWGKSNILVMNHYLFFTNIASGKTYLPPFDVVVFDEAHSLEDIAAGQIGFRIGYRELGDIIARFHDERKRTIISEIEEHQEKTRAVELIKKIKKESSLFFESMRKMMPGQRGHFRLKEPVPFGNRLVDFLKEFLVVMTKEEKVFAEDHPMRGEFDIARGMLFSYIENLSNFVERKQEAYVYWVERESGAILGDILLRGQPVEIDEIFRREVIHCYDSSIFVSATLAVGDDFSYIINRLGIENVTCLPLKTSFDYRSQVVLYVAGDLADPSSPRYGEEAAGGAAEIINHLNGNCLMLFTSYKTLREIKEALVGMISFPIHSQDEMTSTEAYERYVGTGESVLMGTHSFWQGVDLPGDLVRGVLLMKLPFAVPDLPPVEAKIERISQQGKNPFASFQVPEAVIRFRQGFGRLIRSGKDRGVVAVLDSRIVTRSYGKLFLKSIPECRVVYSIKDLKEAYSLISC